jgi:Protein of unknown function (DUF2723)
MNFKKINNVSGWIVCAIACTVYIITRQPTVSFWDCGEFTPAAYKLQITHAPGAPLFILLGRLFIILFSGNWDATLANPHAAIQVNLLSSLSSGFAILFLFWTITHLAKKLMLPKGEVITTEKMIAIIGAGAVGALAFAFSDSFWFSAVEAIVFGVSPLFIAMSFWTIMKWEEHAGEPGADRWIILLAYIIGLSVGVHLLSLLSIPAIVMTYYFTRFRFSRKGMLLAFLIACVLTGVVQFLIIQDTIKVMGWFELLFVNSLGLPFNSGCFFFILLLVALIVWGIRWGKKHAKYYLQLGLYCFAFILLGYSPYAVIMIRANADPAVNMQNVNNPIELVAYLDRSQYGEWPIISGADFTARPINQEETGNIYYKDETTGKYEVVGKKQRLDYDPSDIRMFPRLWDTDNSQGHVDYYKSYLGLGDGDIPTGGDDLRWLLDYQFNWMYWRYFMWNFAGRQNDLQGTGNPRDGNWITGISFYDNLRLGDQSRMPDSLRQNKAHTTLFLLPLLLGVLGLVFQWRRDKAGAVVVFLLYFFTGIAIVLYLNQAGPQPRERDYSYVGSFYAFAIWIGLGVLFVYDWLKRSKLAGLTAAGLAMAICMLGVPVLMISQEWKAHDRSHKTLARDAASDYLNSCAPQSILFTGGDNDTYPLWYDQEVENIRPDVRVIVTSLLGTDWMINQLRRKINQSDPIPMSWSPDKYLGDNRNDIPFSDQGKVPKGAYMDINDAMAFMGSDSNQLETQSGERVNYFPTHNFSIPVDKQAVIANGTVAAKDSARIPDKLDFTFSGNNLFKNDAMELNIIAANKWRRPIDFTEPMALGLNNYLRSDGLAYRLTPLDPDPDKSNVDVDTMYRNLMYRFKFGGAENPDMYFDENGRRILLSLRNAFSALGQTLASRGNKDSALKVLNYGYTMLNRTTLTYGATSAYNQQDISGLQYAFAFYLAGDPVKGRQIADAVLRDCHQQVDYYNSLSDTQAADFSRDLQTARQIISQAEGLEAQFAKPAASSETPKPQK